MKLRGGWIVLGLGLANLVNYASRNALIPVHDALIAKHGLSNQWLGILDAGFIFAHAVATPVMGWLGDRVHRLQLLMVAVLVAAVALWLGALASAPWMVLVTRIVGGVATAAVVPVANSILGELAMTLGDGAGNRKARLLSWFSLGLLFGGVVAFGLGTALPFPWHLVVLGAIGLATVGVLSRLQLPTARHRPEGDAAPPHARTRGSAADLIASLCDVGRIPALRLVLVSATLMAFAAGSFSKWLYQYLTHERGMSRGDATTLFAMCFVTGAAGVLVGGAVADAWRRARVAGRLFTMALGMSLTVPCSLWALHGAQQSFVVVCVLNMFFISWYHGPMAATIDDLAPPGMAATAQSLVILFMHSLGTSLGIYLVGLIADHHPLSIALSMPIGAVVLAAVVMLWSTRSFARQIQVAAALRAAPGALS